MNTATAAIFVGLSGYALTTRKDFSFMGGFLMVGILWLHECWSCPGSTCLCGGRWPSSAASSQCPSFSV